MTGRQELSKAVRELVASMQESECYTENQAARYLARALSNPDIQRQLAQDARVAWLFDLMDGKAA